MSNISLKKILVVHNRYLQYGGEDSVVASEMDLLKSHGHEVQIYTRDNQEIARMGKLGLFVNSVWSSKSQDELRQLISDFCPDIIHVHNTLPLISPVVYWVASEMKVPIVQTIHNFRLACLQAMFLRDGEVCEDCLGKTPWRGVMHKCYRGSLSASLASAISLQTHRVIGTYRNKVGAYIALNDFCRNKLVEMGLRKERIFIKPNFVSISTTAESANGISENPLFVGRLSKDKGVEVLADAVKAFPDVMFDVVGVGPEEHVFNGLTNVNLKGNLPLDDVYALMRAAPFLIMPSIWYENMPRTLVESFGCGTPVIASQIGALAELVENEKSGLLFNPGSYDDLCRAIKWAIEHPAEMRDMGGYACEKYNREYTEEQNYAMLIDIYERVTLLGGI